MHSLSLILLPKQEMETRCIMQDNKSLSSHVVSHRNVVEQSRNIDLECQNHSHKKHQKHWPAAHTLCVRVLDVTLAIAPLRSRVTSSWYWFKKKKESTAGVVIKSQIKSGVKVCLVLFSILHLLPLCVSRLCDSTARPDTPLLSSLFPLGNSVVEQWNRVCPSAASPCHVPLWRPSAVAFEVSPLNLFFWPPSPLIQYVIANLLLGHIWSHAGAGFHTPLRRHEICITYQGGKSIRLKNWIIYAEITRPVYVVSPPRSQFIPPPFHGAPCGAANGWVSGNEKLMKLLANLGWRGRKRGREEGSPKWRLKEAEVIRKEAIFMDSTSWTNTYTHTHKHAPSLSAHSSSYISFFV